MQLRKYFTAPFAALLLTGASLANAATPIDVTWNPTGAGITNAGAFTFDNVLINTCEYRHHGWWDRLLGAGIREADRVLG